MAGAILYAIAIRARLGAKAADLQGLRQLDGADDLRLNVISSAR